MSCSKKRNNQLVEEFQPPPKKIVSQADLFITELAKKQQNPTINLQHQLANPKEFCKGAELLSLANYTAGPSSLEEFKTVVTHFENIGFLKGAGLTEDEIKLYLDYQKGNEYLLNKHKNYEGQLLLETVKKITKIVQNHQNKPEMKPASDTRNVELLDVGLSIKPTSQKTKLYKFALENMKSKEKTCLPHPMNDLNHILKSLDVEKMPDINKIRRKARKLSNRVNKATTQSEATSANNVYALDSKWDKQTPEIVIPNPEKQKHLYTCTPQNYYTIKDKQIVKLNDAECQVRDLPFPQRLTEDDIKGMPKFQNYHKGIPSKVLYLKNLRNSIGESDLKIFFKKYDKSEGLVYKVMNGKMRGQAFVTLKDEETAEAALNDLNGVYLKNKPVIIQFGHGKG